MADAGAASKKKRPGRRQGQTIDVTARWDSLGTDEIEAQLAKAERLRAEEEALNPKTAAGDASAWRAGDEPEGPVIPQAYIGNLPFNATPASVKAVMPNKGAGVVNVNLLYHTDGNMKGYGYVQFVDAAALAEACKLNRTLMMGDRQVKIEAKTGFAEVQREKPERGRGRGGRGGADEPKKAMANRDDLDFEGMRGSMQQPTTPDVGGFGTRGRGGGKGPREDREAREPVEFMGRDGMGQMQQPAIMEDGGGFGTAVQPQQRGMGFAGGDFTRENLFGSSEPQQGMAPRSATFGSRDDFGMQDADSRRGGGRNRGGDRDAQSPVKTDEPMSRDFFGSRTAPAAREPRIERDAVAPTVNSSDSPVKAERQTVKQPDPPGMSWRDSAPVAQPEVRPQRTAQPPAVEAPEEKAAPPVRVLSKKAPTVPAVPTATKAPAAVIKEFRDPVVPAVKSAPTPTPTPTPVPPKKQSTPVVSPALAPQAVANTPPATSLPGSAETKKKPEKKKDEFSWNTSGGKRKEPKAADAKPAEGPKKDTKKAPAEAPATKNAYSNLKK